MLYDYQCPRCGLAFEVSRPASRAGEPVACPADGAPGTRVFTMPVTFPKRGAAPAAPAGPVRGFTHHGHRHGPGTGAHSHG
jgi:putative FmdB family regulatory protein